jgi:lysozyme family protein
MSARAKIVADYQKKFDTMQVTRASAVEAAAKRIIAHYPTYKAVEAKTGVPAAFVGVLHMRECNNDMRGCLHNGELIIGTQRKTKLVPRGYGPFATFLDSAVSALGRLGMLKVRDWSPGVCLYEGEAFNGLGYRLNGYSNPYLWGGTKWYTRGKYVRDHVYSATFNDPQLGIAPVIKRVMELAGETQMKRKTIFRRAIEKRAETKEIVKEDKRLTWGARYNSFCEFLGLTWAAIMLFVEQSAALLTDWRVVAVLMVLGSAYVASQFFKWKVVTAKTRAKFVIPAADKPKTKRKAAA